MMGLFEILGRAGNNDLVAGGWRIIIELVRIMSSVVNLAHLVVIGPEH